MQCVPRSGPQPCRPALSFSSPGGEQATHLNVFDFCLGLCENSAVPVIGSCRHIFAMGGNAVRPSQTGGEPEDEADSNLRRH
jgi:hypothetical protein